MLKNAIKAITIKYLLRSWLNHKIDISQLVCYKLRYKLSLTQRKSQIHRM